MGNRSQFDGHSTNSSFLAVYILIFQLQSNQSPTNNHQHWSAHPKSWSHLANVMAGQPPPLTYPPQKWGGVGWPAMKMNFPSDHCAETLRRCSCCSATSRTPFGSLPTQQAQFDIKWMGRHRCTIVKGWFFDRKWWLHKLIGVGCTIWIVLNPYICVKSWLSLKVLNIFIVEFLKSNMDIW